MAGYTSSFLSVDGELISANLFTQEYAALEAVIRMTVQRPMARSLQRYQIQ